MGFPVMAALAGAQALYGIYQAERARSQAAKLQEPKGYEITPEQRTSYERAQQMAKMGFTPEERGQFYQNVAAQQNLAYARAKRSAQGNQWSGAILAGIQAPQYKSFADFAAADARQKAANIRYADQRGADISAQTNRETSRLQQRYQMLQTAYGQAQRQGIQNVMNAAWLAGSAYGGGGGTTKTENPEDAANKTVTSMQPISPMMAMSRLPGAQYQPPQYSDLAGAESPFIPYATPGIPSVNYPK